MEIYLYVQFASAIPFNGVIIASLMCAVITIQVGGAVRGHGPLQPAGRPDRRLLRCGETLPITGISEGSIVYIYLSIYL